MNLKANNLKHNRFVTHVLPWMVCGIASLFYTYEYFLRVAPSVMPTELMWSFHIDAAALGNLAAFYYYAYTPMQLPVGMLMDRFGPRRLLTLACLSCALGSYLFAFSHLLWLASLGRFFIGFGSAFAFVGVLKLATIWLPAERFALVAGLTTTLGMIGAVFGDDMITRFLMHHGWRQTIRYTADIGVLLAIVIFIVVGFGKKLAQQPPLKPIELGLLFKGLLKVISNSQLWLTGVIGSLLYLSLSVFGELWGVLYLEQVHHFSKLTAVHANDMLFFGWAVGAPAAGWISSRIQRRVLPLTLGTLLAAIFITICLYVPHLPKSAVFTTLFLYGLCCSVEAIVFAIGREKSPEKLSGTALAVINMLVMLSGVLFQPIVGIILDRLRGPQVGSIHRIFSAYDFKIALMVLPIGALLATLLTFFVKETYCKIQT